MKDQSRPKLTADQSTAFSTRSLTMSRQVFVSSFVNKDMINLEQRSKSQKIISWYEMKWGKKDDKEEQKIDKKEDISSLGYHLKILITALEFCISE